MENSDDFTVSILSTAFECNGDDDGDVFVRFSIFGEPDESEATAFFHRLLLLFVDVIGSDRAVAVIAIASIVFSIMNRSSEAADIFAFVRR